MTIQSIPCKRTNYGGKRAGKVQYIVVHYTAGHNDNPVNNGKYFGRADVGASAHYFVDADTIVASVPEDYIAWHCGGAYYYCDCRNSNSIGVEICTRYTNGEYWFDPAAVEHAAEFVRYLMRKHNVPLDHVIRHFDVTPKNCPAPMCGEHHGEWLRFKELLMRYDTIEEVPEWGKATVQKLIDKKLLNGDGNGLDLSRDMLRLLVIQDRAGQFG